jgi:hypothetical protein
MIRFMQRITVVPTGLLFVFDGVLRKQHAYVRVDFDPKFYILGKYFNEIRLSSPLV